MVSLLCVVVSCGRTGDTSLLCVVLVAYVATVASGSLVLPVRMRDMVAGDVPSRLAISRVESPAMLSVMASATSLSRDSLAGVGSAFFMVLVL